MFEAPPLALFFVFAMQLRVLDQAVSDLDRFRRRCFYAINECIIPTLESRTAEDTDKLHHKMRHLLWRLPLGRLLLARIVPCPGGLWSGVPDMNSRDNVSDLACFVYSIWFL